MLFRNYCIFSGSAEALVSCGGKLLLTFSVTCVPNIMKIRQCFLKLQLTMSGMFFETHCSTVVVWNSRNRAGEDSMPGGMTRTPESGVEFMAPVSGSCVLGLQKSVTETTPVTWL